MTGRTGTAIRWTLAVLTVAAVVAAYLYLPFQDYASRLVQWIDGLGAAGPLIFAAVYVLATVCLVPGALLTVVAGAAFGLPGGFATVSVGSTAGAAAAFLISRYFLRETVARRARSRPNFAAIDNAIDEGGWRIVGLLRLSPVVPFNLQNYFLGLTSIGFGRYVVTSWIAMIPGTLLYVYIGHVAGLAATGETASTARMMFLVVGLAATIAVTWYITVLARRKLRATSALGQPREESAGDSSNQADRS